MNRNATKKNELLPFGLPYSSYEEGEGRIPDEQDGDRSEEDSQTEGPATPTCPAAATLLHPTEPAPPPTQPQERRPEGLLGENGSGIVGRSAEDENEADGRL